MKFRFYLVDDTDQITGTNDLRVVALAQEDDSYSFIIDAETGTDMNYLFGEAANIQEQAVFVLPPLPQQDLAP